MDINTTITSSTGFTTHVGPNETITTSLSSDTSLKATFPRALQSLPNVYTDLTEIAHHPNSVFQTTLVTSTVLKPTRPRDMSTSLTPSSILAGIGAKLSALLSSIPPSSILGNIHGKIATLTSSLTPVHSFVVSRVQSSNLHTELTPDSSLAGFPTRFAGIFTHPFIFIQTQMGWIFGQTRPIQTTLTPQHSIEIHREFPEPIPSTISPSTVLAESGSHSYNPTVTAVSVETSLKTFSARETNIQTGLAPSTSLSGPGSHSKPISADLAVSTALARIPVYHGPISTALSPSTKMSVQVNRQKAMHSNVQSWTYIINPAATTYTRAIPEKAIMGGPLLQWLLCRPSVSEKKRPMVVSCLP